jgi:hypothetical protein
MLGQAATWGAVGKVCRHARPPWLQPEAILQSRRMSASVLIHPQISTEGMVIAPPAPDHCKIRSRQRVVTNYAVSISRRVEQLCDLFPGQYPSMTHWSLPPAC